MLLATVKTTQRRFDRRSLLGRLGLTVGAAAVSLLAAEIALRVLGVAPARWAEPRHLESDDKRAAVDVYPDDPRGYFPLDLRDPETRERFSAAGIADLDAHAERTPHAVGFVYTPELCRGETLPTPDDARARVMIVGDSFTEGQGVREEDTFAAVLNRRFEGADVFNCGRRGYDFPELHDWYDDHLALSPDVVVYAMTLNDPVQSEAFHERQRFIDDWILDRRRMVSEGDERPSTLTPRLFALVADRVESARVGAETERWYREMVGPENRAGFEATIRHIVEMRRAMTDRGGELVVVLWPLLVALGPDYPFAEVHRTLREALTREGVPFHDSLADLEDAETETLWVHATDRHPNERAHARFARTVERAIAPLLDLGTRQR
jgi:lysophospholipase L1-like esterase